MPRAEFKVTVECQFLPVFLFGNLIQVGGTGLFAGRCGGARLQTFEFLFGQIERTAASISKSIS